MPEGFQRPSPRTRRVSGDQRSIDCADGNACNLIGKDAILLQTADRTSLIGAQRPTPLQDKSRSMCAHARHVAPARSASRSHCNVHSVLTASLLGRRVRPIRQAGFSAPLCTTFSGMTAAPHRRPEQALCPGTARHDRFLHIDIVNAPSVTGNLGWPHCRALPNRLQICNHTVPPAGKAVRIRKGARHGHTALMRDRKL